MEQIKTMREKVLEALPEGGGGREARWLGPSCAQAALEMPESRSGPPARQLPRPEGPFQGRGTGLAEPHVQSGVLPTQIFEFSSCSVLATLQVYSIHLVASGYCMGHCGPRMGQANVALGPNPPLGLFLYGLRAKNGF